MKNYVVAACTPWHKDLFLNNAPRQNGNWFFVESEAELTIQVNKLDSVEYIFFLHWRSIVPTDILNKYSCVCFHMTDLPYGRGGSPLQNLILSGHTETKVCALRMTEQLDAGPVYLRAPLSLEGTAQEIYLKAAELSWELIQEMIAENPIPKEQSGTVTLFKRRSPKQSHVPNDLSIDQFYDHIRMLDAEGYPRAFINIGNLKLTFSAAEFIDGELNARVVVSQKEDSNDE